MVYPVFAVANEFIRRKVPDLTLMKLQKLIYYTDLWYLYHKKQHLIDETFNRWDYGPVVPSLYHQLKDYKANNINLPVRWVRLDRESGHVKYFTPYIPNDDKEAVSYIESAINTYKDYSASELSAISHSEGSAWSIKGADGSPIIDEEMIMEANNILNYSRNYGEKDD